MFQAVVSRTANYIYHMLSVGKCGYDNAYGAAARPFHRAEDVQRLNGLKTYITVAGGVHCGELYGLCVSMPACLDAEADMLLYFQAMQSLFTKGATSENLTEFASIYQKTFGDIWGTPVDLESLHEFYQSCLPLKAPLLEIIRIFQENYEIYQKKFWENTRRRLAPVCEALNTCFRQERHMEKWEALMHTRYPHGDFYALLCDSIQNGPQAIDISYNRDVFAVPEDLEMFTALVSHEFGIYLLKQLLADTDAFHDFSLYPQVEALAEFFNQKIISGGYTRFSWDEDAIRQYRALYEKNPEISARQMFLSVTGKG